MQSIDELIKEYAKRIDLAYYFDEPINLHETLKELVEKANEYQEDQRNMERDLEITDSEGAQWLLAEFRRVRQRWARLPRWARPVVTPRDIQFNRRAEEQQSNDLLCCWGPVFGRLASYE